MLELTKSQAPSAVFALLTERLAGVVDGKRTEKLIRWDLGLDWEKIKPTPTPNPYSNLSQAMAKSGTYVDAALMDYSIFYSRSVSKA